MQRIYFFLLLLGFLHLFAAALLTKEIIEWPFPKFSQKLFCLAFVWLVPVLGIIWAYKKIKLDWFGKSSGRASGNILLEVDSIFNPGAKHVIESKQEAKMEVKKEEGDKSKSETI